MQDFVLPASVYDLINGGYNVEYQIIPNAGHEVTSYAIEHALEMVKE